MRFLRTIPVLIFFGLFCVSTFAQVSVLDKKVTLHHQQTSIKKVLDDLEVQAGVSFSYSESVVPVEKRVNISLADVTLRHALEDLFKGTLIRFELQSGQVVLYKAANRFDRSKSFTVSGYVTEQGSGENLMGVNVYLPGTSTGTVTNGYGFYSLTLESDTIQLSFSYVGFRSKSFSIGLDEDVNLNVSLSGSEALNEVVVKAEVKKNIAEIPQMSKMDIPVAHVKSIPALLGEKDVLKVIQLMPGVQSGSEGQSGFYVRGGGPDQNLIILDDATVYNAYHLFGFVSLFNGDAIRSIELTKGGFPARYGGRLSSVLDIKMKEGNKEKYSGEAGIGLIASRLMVEGPLQKGKSSFLISGRRTYLDLLARPLMPENQSVGYHFSDFTAKVNYDFGDKDKLYLSTYTGRDKFRIEEGGLDAYLQWGNLTSTLRWNHLFNNRLFSNTAFIYSQYNLALGAENKVLDKSYTLDFSSGIRDFAIKSDLDFRPNSQHTIRGGILSTFHTFTPRAVVVDNEWANTRDEEVERYRALETSIYAEDEYKVSSRLIMNMGLRLSSFLAEEKMYVKPEPRFSAAYLINSSSSIKASYALMNQYIHLISNTGIGLPTDLWVPSTPKIGPQQSQQVAVGYAKSFDKHDLEFTVESYYKRSRGVLSYRDGATFLAVDDPQNSERATWEKNVTSGQGTSYGIELMLQKKVGRLSGWVGYTLSRTRLQFDELNKGESFFARYDRTHDVSVVAIYEISKRIKLSGTWVYGTGNAITLPVSNFFAVRHNPNGSNNLQNGGGIFVSQYNGRNQERMAPYHRMDIGIQFIKEKERYTRTFELSVYNAYNRKNPFFYYVSADPMSGERKLKQTSLFPLIPSISYNISF